MAAYGSLPFAEAIEYLKAKVPQATEHWDDIEGQAHDHTFIVAGSAKADLLTDLHGTVRKGIEQGTTLEEFRRDFDAITAKHGWTGFTGDGSEEGRAWRTKVIYGTNLRTSHQARRLSQVRAIQTERPYWRYRHNDTVAHPRKEHQSWNGKVLPADDPWFQTHYPPNGWGCRCYIETLAPRDLQREGITVDAAPDDGTYEHVDRTGEPHTLPKGVDYGWDHQPGSTRDLVAEVKARAGKMPAGIGADLRADMAQVPLAHRAAADAAIEAPVQRPAGATGPAAGGAIPPAGGMPPGGGGAGLTAADRLAGDAIGGLVHRAAQLPVDLNEEARLRQLWTNDVSFDQHVKRRMAYGHVTSAAHLAELAFAALARAQVAQVALGEYPLMRRRVCASCGRTMSASISTSSGGWPTVMSPRRPIWRSWPLPLWRARRSRRWRLASIL